MLKKNALLIITHFLFLGLCYSLLHLFNVIELIPDNYTISRWDALHYISIKDKGYKFIFHAECNLAFFPFFPFLWKILGLSSIGISIFNFLLFYTCILILLIGRKSTDVFNLFVVSIPSFIFFFLPYSEATFFAFGSLIILGYQRNSLLMICIGFFLASTVRSVSVIFVPAIIITEFVTGSDNGTKWKRILFFLSATLMGMLIAAYTQAAQTGKWFYFIQVQEYWGRHWIVPGVPFTTLSANRILAMDAIALILGLAAIYSSFRYFFSYLKLKNNDLEPGIFFAALVMSGTTILDVFFTYNMDGSANLWSLNRHLLCTPFAVVFLVWFCNEFTPSKKERIVGGLIVVSGIFFTGVYEYPHLAFYYMMFFFGLFLYTSSSRFKNFLVLGYLANVIVQFIFFTNYIYGLWVA